MDELEENDYWPIEGCWSPFDLGRKHSLLDLDVGIINYRAPVWFDNDELDEYKDGYDAAI